MQIQTLAAGNISSVCHRISLPAWTHTKAFYLACRSQLSSLCSKQLQQAQVGLPNLQPTSVTAMLADNLSEPSISGKLLPHFCSGERRSSLKLARVTLTAVLLENIALAQGFYCVAQLSGWFEVDGVMLSLEKKHANHSLCLPCVGTGTVAFECRANLLAACGWTVRILPPSQSSELSRWDTKSATNIHCHQVVLLCTTCGAKAGLWSFIPSKLPSGSKHASLLCPVQIGSQT